MFQVLILLIRISVVLIILLANLHSFIYACYVTVENLDIAELGRLLQLVLGCAVNCEDKQGTVELVYEFMNPWSVLELSLCWSLNSYRMPCWSYRIHSGYYVYGRICSTCSYDGNSRGQLFLYFSLHCTLPDLTGKNICFIILSRKSWGNYEDFPSWPVFFHMDYIVWTTIISYSLTLPTQIKSIL